MILLLRAAVSLHLAVVLVLLLVSLPSLVQFVRRLVKLDLEAVDFLAEVPDVTVGLVRDPVGLLGGLLEAVDDGVETIRLVLEGLHLLPDGVHDDGCCSALVSGAGDPSWCLLPTVPM